MNIAGVTTAWPSKEGRDKSRTPLSRTEIQRFFLFNILFLLFSNYSI